MTQNLLKKLYIQELKDLYNAENQLVRALPKMAKAANSPDLGSGFELHLEQTKGHVSRLEQIFESLDENPKGKTCKGMEGLIKEGGEMIDDGLEPVELDAGLITATQRVEHYEIAGYGSARTHAKLLGEEQAVALLDQTLNEEKETNDKLTQLAATINVEALQSGGSEEEKTAAKPKHLKKSA
jgi:ferritin-like metal-binding protein YciE